MLELLRRLALLTGTGCFLWLWFESPEVLLQVKRADFAAEYQRLYAKRSLRAPTGDGLGASLLPDDMRPASPARFIAAETERKQLPMGDASWSGLYRSLPEGPAFYAIDAPPFSGVRAEIEALFRSTQMAVMYMPVRDGAQTGYLEIDYRDRPKDTKAPHALLYPKRASAWPYLAIALLIYAVLPRRRTADGAAYSRAVPVALDGMALLFAGVFFALPLYAVHWTGEVLGSELGMTIFLWLLASTGLLLMLWSARIAAFRVSLTPSGLRMERLLPAREIPYAVMAGGGFLVRRGIRTGIFIRCRDGRTIKLAWTGVLRFDAILNGLAKTGVPRQDDIEL